MTYIRSIKALEILDSRGNPTLEVTLSTDHFSAKASVPSGASTGEHEALELRDQDPRRYFGKGVLKAVEHVNGPLAELLQGQSIFDQAKLDKWMIEADGTPNKAKFGANAILGVSLALARTAALATHLSLFRYIGGTGAYMLPCPMINIINGGLHADNLLDFQEFMIRPIGAPTFRESLRWSAEIFHTLKNLLHSKGHVTAVGDEGGFAPYLESNELALDLIIQAIKKAGYQVGQQISLALDCAASSFYESTSKSYVEKKRKQKQLIATERSAEEQVAYLKKLCEIYPIDSIEDGLDENDWPGWQQLTEILGKKIQIVGDDLFVTHPNFLKKGFSLQVGNSILIKLNQIGTLTETLETIRLAQTYGYTTIISHRSGETEDSFIADLCVATNSGQIKSGSLSRTDRLVKYNRLLAIEAELGSTGVYQDSNHYKFNH